MPGYIELKSGVSKIGCEFFDVLEDLYGVKIQHRHFMDTGLQGTEFCVLNYGLKGTKVDGYIKDDMIILEFHGDWWHGNPAKYDAEDIHPMNKRTFGELYNKTIRRMEILTRLGYRVWWIWESDFTEWKKGTQTKESLQLYIRLHRNQESIFEYKRSDTSAQKQM